MCVIVDANVSHEVFGGIERPEAGKFFADWLARGNKLVVGGKLLRELSDHSKFRQWFRAAQSKGRTVRVDDDAVEREIMRIAPERDWESNDLHVIALARLSGTRLIFTNDQALQNDFGKIKFGRIKGKNCSTKERNDIRASHKRLLRSNTCFGPCA